MKTKPLNEHLLWKGKIQLANYPKPTLKNNMVGFFEINSLTGTIIKGQPCLYDEYYQKTIDESKLYWANVEKRKQIYRKNLIINK